MDQIVALDSETFFSRELSVRLQGNVPYAVRTDWFLVSLYSPSLEVSFCGPPEDAPWAAVNGEVWVSHNAAFDSAVFYAGRERGQVPSLVAPRIWHCTADLSTYSLLGRSLAVAVENGFGVKLPKTVRDQAKGRKWPDDFTLEQREEFKQYCLGDSIWCFKLWEKYAEDWPIPERIFADIVRRRANAGVAIDSSLLEETIAKLQAIKDAAEDQIPWA